MRKYILAVLLLVAIGVQAKRDRELFRGGMFLHTGYVRNQLDFPQVNGMVTGIGGKITFRTGTHLRFGTEGYVSNYGYKGNEGQYKLGWGGLLAEYQFNNHKIAPVFGITAGGSKVHDLYLLEGNYRDNTADNAIYKVYASFVLTPHFSLEMSVSDHINLVCKLDYVFYPGIGFPDYVGKGPRFYFGILFMR